MPDSVPRAPVWPMSSSRGEVVCLPLPSNTPLSNRDFKLALLLKQLPMCKWRLSCCMTLSLTSTPPPPFHVRPREAGPGLVGMQYARGPCSARVG